MAWMWFEDESEDARVKGRGRVRMVMRMMVRWASVKGVDVIFRSRWRVGLRTRARVEQRVLWMGL